MVSQHKPKCFEISCRGHTFGAGAGDAVRSGEVGVDTVSSINAGPDIPPLRRCRDRGGHCLSHGCCAGLVAHRGDASSDKTASCVRSGVAVEGWVADEDCSHGSVGDGGRGDLAADDVVGGDGAIADGSDTGAGISGGGRGGGCDCPVSGGYHGRDADTVGRVIGGMRIEALPVRLWRGLYEREKRFSGGGGGGGGQTAWRRVLRSIFPEVVVYDGRDTPDSTPDEGTKIGEGGLVVDVLDSDPAPSPSGV